MLLQMVLNGEPRRARQVVKVLNSEGKVIAYAKPRYPMVRFSLSSSLILTHVYLVLPNFSTLLCFMKQFKGSDTSTAESGSEAEDIASPKTLKCYSHLRLTPVREEVGLLFWNLLCAILRRCYWNIVFNDSYFAWSNEWWSDMGMGVEFCFKMFVFLIYSSNFSLYFPGNIPCTLLNISAWVSCKVKTHVLKMRPGCSDNFHLYHLK